MQHNVYVSVLLAETLLWDYWYQIDTPLNYLFDAIKRACNIMVDSDRVLASGSGGCMGVGRTSIPSIWSQSLRSRTAIIV